MKGGAGGSGSHTGAGRRLHRRLERERKAFTWLPRTPRRVAGLEPARCPRKPSGHGVMGDMHPRDPHLQPSGGAWRTRRGTSARAPGKKLHSGSFHAELGKGWCWPDKQPQDSDGEGTPVRGRRVREGSVGCSSDIRGSAWERGWDVRTRQEPIPPSSTKTTGLGAGGGEGRRLLNRK